MPIEYVSPPNLYLSAYELATRLQRPHAYDAPCFVVAQEPGCEFWTADRRLANAASETFPWVRWLDTYSPTTA